MAYNTVSLDGRVGLSDSPAEMRTMRPILNPSEDLRTTRMHGFGILWAVVCLVYCPDSFALTSRAFTC